jgi:hypothetical protein
MMAIAAISAFQNSAISLLTEYEFVTLLPVNRNRSFMIA